MQEFKDFIMSGEFIKGVEIILRVIEARLETPNKLIAFLNILQLLFQDISITSLDSGKRI